MARFKAKQPPGAAKKSKKPPLSSAESSAYFARREAAKLLSVLQGDARRRTLGSIKTLVYSPSIENKTATFALVCQTLKHLPIIKDVLEAANILNSRWKFVLSCWILPALDLVLLLRDWTICSHLMLQAKRLIFMKPKD